MGGYGVQIHTRLCGGRWRIMEKIFEQVLLYDFYGELLTEHQRSIYEDAVCNDLSLGEIAQEHGISRQGVHDLIRRCDRILSDYESKLHLVERFTRARGKVKEIMELAAEPVSADGDSFAPQQRMRRIRELAAELIKEL